ncbi:MAG: transglutaminase domain-containing protein [Candidatus Woesearchaeota archaeon]
MDKIKLDYHVLEMISSDRKLSTEFGSELSKPNPDAKKLEDIISKASAGDASVAKRKVTHAIENQLPSSKEVLREVSIQNTIDAYSDLEGLLAKRGEKIRFPHKVDLNYTKTDNNKYNVEIKDSAIGMNLYDVLFKLLAVGDTSKKDKKYQVGGHGRGFKPSMYYSEKVAVESFSRKTTITKNEVDGRNEYVITIGEDSAVNEGTTITLENLTLKGDPLAVLGELAGSLSENFEFKVNGIRVNRQLDNDDMGKLVFNKSHEINSGKLEESITAASKKGEGVELRQGAMTLFRKEAEKENARRVAKMPPGYLLSRSRNEAPKEVSEAMGRESESSYKEFHGHLCDNIHKIGANEFRFLSSYTSKSTGIKKVASIASKAAKWGAVAFLLGTGLFAGVDQIRYHLTTTHFIGGSHLPSIDFLPIGIPDFMKHNMGGKSKLPFGDYEFLNSPEDYLYRFVREGMSREDALKKVQGMSFPEDFNGVFFKFLSYNTINEDGTWKNAPLGEISFYDKEEEELKPEIYVRLNLDAHKRRSLLPVPINHLPNNVSDHWKRSGDDGMDYDTYTVNAFSKPKGAYPLRYFVKPLDELIRELEFADSDICDAVLNNPNLESAIEELEGLSEYFTWDEVPSGWFISKDPERMPNLFIISNERLYGEGFNSKNLIYRLENGDWIHFDREICTNAQQVKKLLTDVPFEINYPKNIEKQLRKLEQEYFQEELMGLIDPNVSYNHLHKMSDKEAATIVTNIVRQYLRYNTSNKKVIESWKMDNFVNDAMKMKDVDCDVANGIVASMLRQRFNIPSRLAVGLQGEQGIIDINAGHGVVEAYIKGEGWMKFDATPAIDRNAQEVPGWMVNLLEWLQPQVSGAYQWLSGFFGSEGNAEVNPEPAYFYERLSERDGHVWIRKASRKAKYYLYAAPGFAWDHKYHALGGIAALALLGYGFRRKRRKTDIKKIPLFNTYVKPDESPFSEKISLNDGINFYKDDSLKYDEEVSKAGIEKLLNDNKEKGRYAEERSFYSLVEDMVPGKNTAAPANDSEEPAPEKVVAAFAISEDEKLKLKHDESILKQYSSRIKSVKKIAEGICSSNSLMKVNIEAGCKFSDTTKPFSYRNSPFSSKVYMNIENSLFENAPEEYWKSPEMLDSLAYSIVLAKGLPLNSFNDVKKNYLNKKVLK